MNNTWENFETISYQTRVILEDISIVIPTLGRSILSECLYWIASADLWPAECIIVDQGNKPEIDAWVRTLQKNGLNARQICSQKRGRSAGINCGLEQINTRFVAITDDDCFVNADWLFLMTQALRQSPQAIITGRVDPAGDGNSDFCVVVSDTPRVYICPELKAHPLIGGNMGVSMEIVRRIGYFDEHASIHAAEDSDWGYRALKLGIPILYNPEIILRHYSWRNDSQRARRYRDYSRSQGAFYGKYLLSGDLLIPLQAARDLIRAPIRFFKGLARKDQDMIDRGRADLLQLLPGILSGLRRKGV